MTSLVDPVAEFVRIKQAYISSRGASHPTGITAPGGQPLMPPSQLVPKTTWGDVQNFGIKFLAWTSRDAVLKCRALKLKEMGYHQDMTISDLMFAPFTTSINDAAVNAFLEVECGSLFTETTSFRRARDAFVDSMPSAKIWAMNPTIGAQAMMTQKVQSNEIYPHNEEFWGTGSRYAIARSAAGMVPSNAKLFLESVNEAIDELPATLRNAIRAATPSIPFPAIPGFGGLITTLIVWSAVGFGLYYLWKNWKK